MSDNRRNGKILSFRQSGEQLRKKAEGAFRSGDVLKALKLYRSALEQDPDDQQTGLRYAVKPLYLCLIAAFAGCWLLGSAVSIARLMRSKALAVLSDRE